MPDPVIVATLEIETEGSSPAGALIGADGSRSVFAGWAEFAAAIEAWRAAARDDEPPRGG
jgi:hypothetical protein